MLIRAAGFLGLCILLGLTWIAYRPGLTGPFLFDDYANLPTLGEGGPVTDAASFARYITSGAADPTGRPVALATFLSDAHDWPADPYPFKRTNLILHLLNGALLFLLLRRLGRYVERENGSIRTDLSALIGTACWVLHPLFVSTTLYVVQREAMLSATFTLLGLLGWLAGRTRMERGLHRSSSIIIAASIAAGTLFGVLSKANGVLLPVFVLVIEYALLRRVSPLADARGRRLYRRILSLACIPVAVLIAVGLVAVGLQGLIHGIASQRPWTLPERLMTEPRVLWDYLRLLWLPSPFTPGVFNDQFVVSTSFLKPWTTLPGCLGVAGMIVLGWRARHRHPVTSTAIAFFLAGHAIESTTIPLELYFEHRNYLPAMLMFWPLGLWLAGAIPSTPGKLTLSPSVRATVVIVLVGGLGWMTYSGAQLWGNDRDQAELWAALNPNSPRAQANAAQDEIARGNPVEAIRRLEPLFERRPDEVQLALNLVTARCAMGTLTPADVNRAREAMRTSRDPGRLLASWFERAVAEQAARTCPALDLDALDSLREAGTQNPHFPAGRLQDLAHVEGLIAIQRKQPAAALTAFNQALHMEPRLGLALQQAATLGAAGYPNEGLEHLAAFDIMPPGPKPSVGMPALHAWILDNQGYWPRERARLESTLRNDLRLNRAHP
jgi:tetratricopeptide (TPR) repeat protein